jgi:glycerol-3-phosphate dehydrogenase
VRRQLSSLAGHRFDVAVIGAGANGASAAQHMAAEGYDVLLVDKGDFASGSSSRSSRLLHCGLRYLAPGSSLWEFARHPSRFLTACRMARGAMQCRAEFVQTTPERVRPINFAFPFYSGSPYTGWQIDAAFRILAGLGPRAVPLDYRRLPPAKALGTPLIEHLRDPSSLRGVAMFREYQFEWPERIVVDCVLDAERMGATVRNYTAVSRLARRGNDWEIGLSDSLDENAETVAVTAGAVFNMAGIWIDEVNRRIEGGKAGRRITGTKGAHLVVRLPSECQDYGIVTINRLNEPFYCVPWRGLHYFGPTETLYEGDLDAISVSEDEIAGLIEEANYLLPGLAVKRDDILYTWAGVRPLTYDPDQPMGARSRELHDFSAEGLPGLFAMTAGPIMTHRLAGREAAAVLGTRMTPTKPRQEPSYRSLPLPLDETSPPLLNHDDTVRLADVRHAAEHEHAETLADVLFRRTGAGWSETMAREGAQIAAQILGEQRGWTPQRIEREVQHYVNRIAQLHGASATRVSNE